MKKYLAILVSILLLLGTMSGCAKAKDATMDATEAAAIVSGEAEEAAVDVAEAASGAQNTDDSASAFFGAYMEAKSAVLTKITDGLSNNPDTLMSAMSYLGATLSDLYLLPAMYFGLGESSVATALAMMGAKDVKYDEQGNNYTVTYKNSDELEAKLVGTYDKGKSLVCVGSTAGTENVFSDVYRTSFGYVGQFYALADDGTATLYQFAISGADGVIGMSTGGARPAALTGAEAADFPKSAKEWFAINGTTITGIDSEGKPVSFEYVPSETDDSNG